MDEAGRVFDFHALRHTCGSWLIAAGVRIKVVQRIMRHSSIALTGDTYGHTFLGDEAAAVAKLPDLTQPSDQEQRATGTYDGVALSPHLAQNLAQTDGQRQTDTDCSGLNINKDAANVSPDAQRKSHGFAGLFLCAWGLSIA